MTEPTQPDPLDIPEDAEFYTTLEMAQIFRVDPKTVGRWHKRKVLERHGITVIFTPGGHKRYKKADVDRAYQELMKPRIDG